MYRRAMLNARNCRRIRMLFLRFGILFRCQREALSFIRPLRADGSAVFCLLGRDVSLCGILMSMR